jgi:dephospho-CoA kinase
VLRVGLTGGIASGKSVVSAELRRLGVPVVDADAVAHEVIEPGRPAHGEIVARFGPTVVGGNGAIDRQSLGRIVFGDAAARADLERMTHGRVMAEVARRLADFAAVGHPIAVCEVPLLFEAGLAALFDHVVVVAASEETQLARVAARDGLTGHEAAARLAAQMPTAEKVRAADEVLWNDGGLEDLRAQVRALRDRLRGAAVGRGS